MGEAEMRNRISIITAVAALGIPSVGPMTSVASGLPKQKGNTAQCALKLQLWEAEVREAEKAASEGNQAEFNIWISVAEEEYAKAKALKCAWATSQPAPNPPTNQERPSTKGLAP
jgi:hypothetical protein